MKAAPRPGLARLDIGQRVYVRRDESGAAIGAWGTVARLRRGDDRAWVKLDTRHPRCAFPADDATRPTMLLTYPGFCSSVAPAAPAQSGKTKGAP